TSNASFDTDSSIWLMNAGSQPPPRPGRRRPPRIGHGGPPRTPLLPALLQPRPPPPPRPGPGARPRTPLLAAIHQPPSLATRGRDRRAAVPTGRAGHPADRGRQPARGAAGGDTRAG